MRHDAKRKAETTARNSRRKEIGGSAKENGEKREQNGV